MAIQIGPDGLLQLVVGGGLLEPQAQVVLQVLVELVTWKQDGRRRESSNETSGNPLVPPAALVLSFDRKWRHEGAVTFRTDECCRTLKALGGTESSSKTFIHLFRTGSTH